MNKEGTCLHFKIPALARTLWKWKRTILELIVVALPVFIFIHMDQDLNISMAELKKGLLAAVLSGLCAGTAIALSLERFDRAMSSRQEDRKDR